MSQYDAAELRKAPHNVLLNEMCKDWQYPLLELRTLTKHGHVKLHHGRLPHATTVQTSNWFSSRVRAVMFSCRPHPSLSWKISKFHWTSKNLPSMASLNSDLLQGSVQSVIKSSEVLCITLQNPARYCASPYNIQQVLCITVQNPARYCASMYKTSEVLCITVQNPARYCTSPYKIQWSTVHHFTKSREVLCTTLQNPGRYCASPYKIQQGTVQNVTKSSEVLCNALQNFRLISEILDT